MKRVASILLGAASLTVAGCAAAQSDTVTTPEGARMQVSSDLAYKPGELTPEQLASSTRGTAISCGRSSSTMRR